MRLAGSLGAVWLALALLGSVACSPRGGVEVEATGAAGGGLPGGSSGGELVGAGGARGVGVGGELSAPGGGGVASPLGGGGSTETPAGGSSSAGAGGTGGVALGEGGSIGGGTTHVAVPLEPTTVVLMDAAVFYDGYAVTVQTPPPPGILRLDNSLLAVRLTAEQLATIQSELRLHVEIGALCDNYDRIGSVRLALVSRGAASYEASDAERIELGRFITPFMDKNRQPDTVSYDWDLSHVAPVLTDPVLQQDYDFWIELSVFGVPYAANDEVVGCAGRSDVFRGSVTLSTDGGERPPPLQLLLPLALDQSFNDYQPGATDELGTTKQTIEVALERNVASAQLVLVTSNHGANAGGEEYVRRQHYVRFDGELVLQYLPGRTTCEPFRQYNTQANGIYGSALRSQEDWQSFSNWCPGDVIDNRLISLGPLQAGSHEFVLEVPDAVFADDQGNIPFSLFLLAP